METKQRIKDYVGLAIGGAIGWLVTHLVWTRWGEIKSALRALFGA